MAIVSSISDFVVRNRTVFIMGLAALIIAGTADLFAGLLLDSMEEYLLLIPGMMVLIYSAIGMRGNIFGAMGSRIGTAMHMGTFQMNFKKGGVLRANIESAMCLSLVLSAAMGIVTWVVAKYLFNGPYSVWDFVFISSLGGLLSGMLVVMFNILIAKEGYKKDWDVDNITAPLIAAIGDIITMPMIFLSTILFLKILDLNTGEQMVMVFAIIFIVAAVVYTAKIVLREYSKRDYSGETKRIVINSLPVLLFCLIFEIGAGITIQNEEEKLFEYSVLLIMLPAFLNQGNALSGMLTSRLSSMIHLGTLKTKAVPSSDALENFNIMYICAMLTFLYIGLMAYLATILFSGGSDNMGIGTALLIILIAGFLATTLLNFLSYYVAILATRFGLDPDDHCIPITSSIMDLIGSMILVCVILFFI